MLPALVLALASSSLLYIITPRMPLYQVTSLKVVSVALWPILYLQLSVTIRAGVRIVNENFVGADVHAALVDLYFPDWHGVLRHIGDVTDSPIPETVDEDDSICRRIEYLLEDGSTLEGIITTHRADAAKQCLPSPPRVGRQQSNTSQVPFFTIHPRQTTHSTEDLVLINLRNIDPPTYLNVARYAIVGRGKLIVPSTGVAHIKSTMGLPLTIGIMCDNAVDLLSTPLKISGRDCVVKSIAAGWSHIEEHGEELRAEALKRHAETGSVLDRREGEFYMGTEKEQISSTQAVIDWHDF